MASSSSVAPGGGRGDLSSMILGYTSEFILERPCVSMNYDIELAILTLSKVQSVYVSVLQLLD